MKKNLLMAAALCGLLWTADVTAQTPTLWPSGAEIWVYVEKPSTTSDMKVYEENYLGQMVRLDRDQIQERVITYFMQCLNSWKGFCDLNLTFRKYLDGTAPDPNAQYKISIEMASVSGGHFFGEQTPPLQVGSEIRSQGGLNPNGNVISYDFVSSEDNNFVYTPPPYEYYNHVDLKTVLFHEAGHAMGMPHVPIDNNIYRPVDRPAMYEGYQGVIRAANAHDKDVFKSLYNNNGGSCPPYIHTYVQNSFLGGQVFVDYQHDNNQDGLKTIPVWDANDHTKNYYSLNWPENSAPTVSAIDGQAVSANIMRYLYWYDGAYEVQAEWVNDQYDITFNNTDNGELWQAYFKNQINLTFVQPIDCMGQTVEAQYVITSNSGSPVAQTNTFTNYAQAYYVEDRTTVFSVEVQPLAGHTFLMWSDGQTSNPREFAPTSDLQVYAICAPHLGSDHLNDDMESVGPTASNNQRKIMYVEGSPGYHHQVYESCGYILYSRSSDNGWHWEPELPVSMLSADASRPSLYADVTGVYVVWCEGSLIRVAEVDPDNRTVNYYPISQLPLARDNATPVIAHTDYNPDSEVIVVYEWDNSCEIIGVLFENGQYVNTFSPSYYSCVQGDQVHPSITNDNTYHQLVWRDGDEVWFREFTVNGVPGGPPVLMFPGYEEKVSMGNRSAMGAPSIAVNRNSQTAGILAAVACETGTLGNSGISVTLRQNGGWTHVQTFLGAGEMGRLWAPSVSMIDQPSQTSAYENFRMAYNQTYPYFNPTDRSVHAMMPWWVNGQLVNYGFEEHGSPALHPSITPCPKTAKGLSVFSEMSSGSTISAINNHNGTLWKAGTMSTFVRSRELQCSVDTSVFAFGLANLSVLNGSTSSEIEWSRGVDTLVVGRTITVEDEFRTKPFYCSPGTKLRYLAVDSKNGSNSFPGSLELKLEVLDNANNSVLGTLGSIQPQSVATGKRRAKMTSNLSAYSGKSIYLRLSLVGQDTTVSLAAQDYWSTSPLDSTSFPKMFSEYELGQGWKPGPNDLTLHQNYPNPFNPTTTIGYSLREAGEIRLVVSDVYGRQITVLAAGVHGAGSYHKQFDASNLPSGTYYYSLHTPQGILSRSMHLVK